MLVTTRICGWTAAGCGAELSAAAAVFSTPPAVTARAATARAEMSRLLSIMSLFF